MKTLQAINAKTKGKKTESLGLMMVIFQILMVLKPELVTPETERAITIAISSGAVSAIGHRIWRNRKNIWDYTKKQFKRLKKAKNK